jgi:hypothetical protein
MTPNAIEVLLHCHVSPTPHPRRDAPAVDYEIQSFLANGLIEEEPGHPGAYRTTLRGRLHVQQLCRLPWPVSVFMGADGKVLELDA